MTYNVFGGTLNPTLLLTFDLIFIGVRVTMMDYPCAKFDNFSFSHFGLIMRSESQTQSHTDTDADDRYTHVARVIT